MPNPKSLIAQLHKHWDVVEALSRLSRDMPAFEPDQVLNLLAGHSSHSGSDDHRANLRSLTQSDVLQWLPRSEHLQLNPLVLDFVRGLTREHELGLSAVLKARVEAIKAATDQLNAGLQANDSDQLRRGAARLSDLFRQISLQLDQDRHAILELAEKAKASDAAIPLAKRYRAVLDAYDHYVEPMNAMMDSGVGGSFYPMLEAAEHALDAATEALSVRGALYTHRLQLRQVAYQAKELRRLGRLVAQQCADTLLPLREEARQHNNLTAAISCTLGKIRKQGLTRALSRRAELPPFPAWQRERRSRINVGDDIRAFMAEARHYEPQPADFPEAAPGAPLDMSGWLDEQAMHQALLENLPIDNLMLWLQDRYPLVPDAILLRCYHDLVRETAWQASLQADSTVTTLSTVRVTYHAHRLLPISDATRETQSP